MPYCLNKAVTVLFPVAMPPVSPTTIMRPVALCARGSWALTPDVLLPLPTYGVPYRTQYMQRN